MTTTTTTVYRFIIDDVIRNIKAEFESKGVDEQVLVELQTLWENNLDRSGVLSTDPVELPRKGSKKASSKSQTSKGSKKRSSGSSSKDSVDDDADPDDTIGKPKEYVGPAKNWKQSARSSQTDGLCVADSPEPTPSVSSPLARVSITIPEGLSTANDTEVPNLLQVDGLSDGEKFEDLDNEELGSDLDDSDPEPEPEHMVLCQHEKVIRNKTKRKCHLKHGIIHVHGRDYVFNKAHGEFEWYV